MAFSTAGCDFTNGKIAVEATATQMQNAYHDWRWYATYTVNGQTYTSLIQGSSQDIRECERITVYYETNNPIRIWRNAESGRVNTAIIILCMVGAAFLRIFIYGYIYNKKHSNHSTSSEENFKHYQNPYKNSISENNPDEDIQNDIHKF